MEVGFSGTSAAAAILIPVAIYLQLCSATLVSTPTEFRRRPRRHVLNAARLQTRNRLAMRSNANRRHVSLNWEGTLPHQWGLLFAANGRRSPALTEGSLVSKT